MAVLPPPEPVRGKPISAAAIRRAAAAEEPGTWDLVKGLLSKSSFQVSIPRQHSPRAQLLCIAMRGVHSCWHRCICETSNLVLARSISPDMHVRRRSHLRVR